MKTKSVSFLTKNRKIEYYEFKFLITEKELNYIKNNKKDYATYRVRKGELECFVDTKLIKRSCLFFNNFK